MATGAPEVGGRAPGRPAGAATDLATLRARVRDEGLTEVRPGPNAVRLVLQVALYLALFAAGMVADHLLVWAVVSVAMAVMFLAPGAVLHQSVHGLVFRHAWANRLVGEACGAVLLFPRGTYRAYHVEHHARTATDDDPEGRPIAFGSRLELCLLVLGGVYTVGQLWWFTARTVVGRPPRWVRTPAARRQIVVSALVVAVFLAGVVVAFAAAPRVVLHLWLVPYLVAVFVVYPLVFFPEHSYGAPGPALENSRTTTSNRPLSWVFWNNNFHAIHHLLPMTVHQHAPALSAAVRDQQPGDWWNPGYLRYTWSVARRLPTFPARRPRDEVIDLRD